MRMIRVAAGAVLLSCCGAAVHADEETEKILYVDPPMRLITQCELRTWNARELTCERDGVPRTVTFGPGLIVWKGQDRHDTSALRQGDKLDIKLGLDAQSREVATFVWANLVKVEGVVDGAMGNAWVRVRPLVPYSIGEVAAEPVFALLDGSTEFLGGARRRDLRPGRAVIVIGERLDGTRLRANRILPARE